MMKVLFLVILFFAPVFSVFAESKKMKELQGLLNYYEGTLDRHSDKLESTLKDISRLEADLEMEQKSSMPIAEAVESKEQMLAERLDMSAELRELELGVGRLNAVLEGYKNAFVRKGVNDGAKLGNITTLAGITYYDSYVSSTSRDSIQIRHSGGFATLAIGDLPEALKTQLVLEPTPVDVQMSYENVLASKPRFLMTRGDFERISTEKLRQRDEEIRLSQLREEERMRQEEERRRLADARTREVKLQIAELENQKGLLRARKSELYTARMNATANGGRIPKSQVEINNIARRFDQSIAAIEKQINGIDAEIRLLRSRY